MGYLYGNSEPFPQEYDFISALDAFITGAVKGLALDAEAREMAESLSAAREERERSLSTLTGVHGAAVEALRGVTPAAAEGAVSAYVEGLASHAAGLLESLKGKIIAEGEAADRQQETELINKRVELRATLGSFLSVLKLEVDEATVSMKLSSGRPELSAEVRNPGGLGAVYALDSARLPEWQSVRKVLEFTAGLRLPMDVKRGWFSGSVQHETIPVGDYFIGGCTVSKSSAVVRLKRKIGDSDAVVLELSRTGDDVVGTMRQPGTGAEAGERTPIAETEKAALEELWQKLWESCERALEQKSMLQSLYWQGEDLVEGEAVPAMLRSVVELIAPTLREVDEKSPNTDELSLKYEAEAGRREEIYRKKKDLADKYASLADSERAIFAALKLT